jgi:hypothetical protein
MSIAAPGGCVDLARTAYRSRKPAMMEREEAPGLGTAAGSLPCSSSVGRGHWRPPLGSSPLGHPWGGGRNCQGSIRFSGAWIAISKTRTAISKTIQTETSPKTAISLAMDRVLTCLPNAEV